MTKLTTAEFYTLLRARTLSMERLVKLAKNISGMCTTCFSVGFAATSKGCKFCHDEEEAHR